MFGKRIDLFKLLGFRISIDMSWVVLAILIAWSLSAGMFPFHYEGLSTGTYWIMGIVGAIGLFASIIAHELSHSLVARRLGMPIKGITLFIFGGVAEMKQEPHSPKAELMIAIAGPVSSLLMALVFFVVYSLGKFSGWPEAVYGVVNYLAWINAILAIFNLVPAFPLDGGRILRSLLWGWKGDLRWSTRVASQIGAGFGIFLIILGVLQFFSGNFIGGMWWFIIGMFVRGAAKAAYQQLLVRHALEGEPIHRFMKNTPVTVPAPTSIDQFVEDFVYRHHFKFFPVTDHQKRLIGCVTTKPINRIPRDQWHRKTVAEIVQACSPENTISPQTDAMQALALMNRTGSSRLMVTEGDRLVGVISLKDMLRFFELKVELEP